MWWPPGICWWSWTTASCKARWISPPPPWPRPRPPRPNFWPGPPTAQIAGAQAQLAAAQGGLSAALAQEDQVKAGVAAAQAQVAIAQAQYADLASHPTAGEVAAAEGDLGVAQAGVRQAQAAYNIVKGDPNIGARPESMALQQATERLNAAQARHDLAIQGATRSQLAVVNSQILAAQAQVAVTGTQLPAAQAGVLSAQAGVDGAQASLDALLDGATVEDKAMAAARVNSARAHLAAAQAQLAQTRITAPFAGQVGMLFKRTGELASPGVPVLMLGDTTHMQVETTDLQETDVTRLAEGLPVAGHLRRPARPDLHRHHQPHRPHEHHGQGQHQLPGGDRRGEFGPVFALGDDGVGECGGGAVADSPCSLPRSAWVR